MSRSDRDSSIESLSPPPPPPPLDPFGGFGQGAGGTSALGSLTRRQVPSSPYLSYDPRVVSPANDSPWIFPDGTTSRPARGLFEMAFCQIGASVMAGAAIGGSLGWYNGVKSLSSNQQPTAWAIKRSTVLNYITRNASNTSNTFGTVAVVFSAIGVALNWGLQLDEKSSAIASATSTGLLYGGLSDPKAASATSNKLFSQAGASVNRIRLNRSLAGGAVGLVASIIYTLTNKDSR